MQSSRFLAQRHCACGCSKRPVQSIGQDHIARKSLVFEPNASITAPVFLIPYMRQHKSSVAHLVKSKTRAQKSYGILPSSRVEHVRVRDSVEPFSGISGKLQRFRQQSARRAWSIDARLFGSKHIAG